MPICQRSSCMNLANASGYCPNHESKPSRNPLGGAKGQEILAIMVGDELRIGDTHDDVTGVMYEITSIEGDDSNAQIYLRDNAGIRPSRVIHYHKVD